MLFLATKYVMCCLRSSFGADFPASNVRAVREDSSSFSFPVADNEMGRNIRSSRIIRSNWKCSTDCARSLTPMRPQCIPVAYTVDKKNVKQVHVKTAG